MAAFAQRDRTETVRPGSPPGPGARAARAPGARASLASRASRTPEVRVCLAPLARGGRGLLVPLGAALLALTTPAIATLPLEAQGTRPAVHAEELPTPPELADAEPDELSLFRASDLLYAGLFLGSLAAVEPLEGLDEGLSPEGVPSGLAGGLHEVGNVAGNAFVVYGLSGAVLFAGEALGSDRVSRVGLRALESLAAADLLTGTFKVGVGRQRPSGPDADPDVFDAFTFDREHASFPSGHTAHLFALASALSGELGEDAPWVPWVAYPVAALTGASRVIGKEHWVTDVVAGAAAGLFAGHFVRRLHGGEPGGGESVPLAAAGPEGVVLGVSLRVR